MAAARNTCSACSACSRGGSRRRPRRARRGGAWAARQAGRTRRRAGGFGRRAASPSGRGTGQVCGRLPADAREHRAGLALGAGPERVADHLTARLPTGCCHAARCGSVRRHERDRHGMPRLAPGGGAADAAQQPASRRRREPRRARRLRRDRQGGAQLVLATTRSSASCAGSGTTRRCWSSRASRWGCSRPTTRRPRVLIANSNLVPQWATWEKFRELDAAGLMMYGQMTAGSWIYIGSQGILQGTYETFAAAARKRLDGTLAGRLVVTAGLGGMGGAQPLAITMLGGAALCVEVDLHRIERRIETGYLDERAGRPRRRAGAAGRRPRRAPRAVDRPGRQRRRDPARAGAPWRRDRRRHRPDERPRSAERLRPRGADGRAGGGRCAAPIPTTTSGGWGRAR